MAMNRPTALEVARYIVRFAHLKGSLITNLKLQKLLYYAQGWYLVIEDDLLFQDRIEAWIHGPVVPTVYREYKKFRWMPIDKQPQKVGLPRQIEEFLDEFLSFFLPIDAYKLEQMTHTERPWKEARGDLEPDESCSNEMSTETMKSYFNSLN